MRSSNNILLAYVLMRKAVQPASAVQSILCSKTAQSLLATPVSAVVVPSWLPRALANTKSSSWRHSHAPRRHDCIPPHYSLDPWHDLNFRKMEWESEDRVVVMDSRRTGENPKSTITIQTWMLHQ
jgi:hypothetical protein